MTRLIQILLFALIYLMPFGPYLGSIDLGPIHIFPFRVVLATLVCSLLFTKKFTLGTGPFTKRLTYLLIAWLAYAGISLIWAENRAEAVKDIFYLVVAVAVHISLAGSLASSDNDKYLGRAWLLGFIFINALAFFEMETGQHMSKPFLKILDSKEVGHAMNFTPVTTLNNPNNYALYLLFSLPILTLFLRKYKRVMPLLWGIVLYQVAVNASRFGLMAYIAMAVIWIGYALYLKWREGKPFTFKHVGVTVGIVVLTILGTTFTNEWRQSDSFSTVIKHDLVDEIQADTVMNSFQVRKGLMLNGIHYAKESYGMGIGAGQFSHYNQVGHGNEPTGTVRNPHCFSMEILSQYGVLILIPWLALLALAGFYFLGNAWNPGKEANLVEFGLMMLICYIPMSNATSSFILNPLNWVALSLMMIAADRMVSAGRKPRWLKEA